MASFEESWKRYSNRVESALEARLVSGSTEPSELHEAIQFACLGGGKRFRAMLVYACGEISGASLSQLDTPASAVEMVHAYSLVHDDMPAMDDDSLRRGRPTVHIKYDEATAVLVGDALQSRAFEILASEKWNPVPQNQKLRMIQILSNAIGSQGMAGGQALDMTATGNSIEYDDLVQIHQLKTGALIRASAIVGALAGEKSDDSRLENLGHFASDIGLAFQITDDILDHTSTSELLGKASGADVKMKKATYVSILGLDSARAHAEKLSDRAIESIQCLGDNRGFLEQLAQFVVSRSY